MELNIYYVWVGESEMPNKLKKYISTWSRIRGANIIKIGNECEEINTPFMQWAWKNKNWCSISNYMRAYSMYNWGGIYMDTDVEVVRDSEVWRSEKTIIAKEMPNWINSHVIISHKKGNPIFKSMIEKMDSWDFTKTKDIELEAGPRLITRTMESIGYQLKDNKDVDYFNEIEIHPESVFSPHRWNEKFHPSEIKPETLAIHHFTKLW